jgi:AhpD family alkylhydroperoxidase
LISINIGEPIISIINGNSLETFMKIPATANHVQRYEQLKILSAKLISEIPDVMAGFGTLHSSAVAKGALDSKSKELIALGIAIAVHCDGCIAFHVHDALKAGASRQETVEAIGVAILMGGGPSMVYGCEALEALNEFEQEQNPPI